MTRGGCSAGTGGLGRSVGGSPGSETWSAARRRPCSPQCGERGSCGFLSMIDRRWPDGFRRIGVHRLPAGPRHPPGIHPARPVRYVNSRVFQASQLDAGLRWLPKNPALSLAKCRAAPPSILFGPERNRKTKAWQPGPRLDPGSQSRCPPRGERQSARAHDPGYIAMDTVRRAIRLAVRCFVENCLAD